MNHSLERIYPDELDELDTLGKEALELHLQRYRFACDHLQKGWIADAACGAGYGSYMIATEYGDEIKKITAVDIDSSVLTYAKQRYVHPAIDYLQADLSSVYFSHPLNTIVSLETIEHLPNPQQFITHMVKQLAPGGRFIASAPVTPSVDANPYHLHDFTEKSFRKLFTKAGLTEVTSLLQIQKYKPLQVTNNTVGRSKDIRRGLFKYYVKHPSSLLKRLKSICIDGFTNKYLVVVYEKREEAGP